MKNMRKLQDPTKHEKTSDLGNPGLQKVFGFEEDLNRITDNFHRESYRLMQISFQVNKGE